MARIYFGLNYGESADKVTRSASPTGKNVELSFDVDSSPAVAAAAKDKALVIFHFRMIADSLVSEEIWPPAVV